MEFRDKKVLVVGMARSGIAVAQLLVKHGAQVVINDSKTEAELGDSLAPLTGLPVERALGCPAAEAFEGVDIMVISPGISINAGFVKQAVAMGIQVTGELETAYELSQGEMVAITGTNGKTTTTTLIAEIFRNSGRTAWAVGNIGYPYSQAALENKPEDIFVCEVSSFQMETAQEFHPHVAVLTNITEDHLNRHGTMEEYTRMKMRCFARQTAEDVAVFNDDDPALKPLYGQVASRVMLFSRLHEVAQGAFVRDGQILVRWNGKEEIVCGVEEVYIPGPHNTENALAAVCITYACGVPAAVIADTLKTFRGVEHRIEFVRELEGVRYINDSKGTNVDSTIKAVQTMQRPTAIILGGYDKHCDFTPMVREMIASPMLKEAVLIGVTAQQIEDTLRREGWTAIHRAATLEEAVQICRSVASDGWNVLLSPACASFDMFSDYESRGRIFKEIVNALN